MWCCINLHSNRYMRCVTHTIDHFLLKVYELRGTFYYQSSMWCHIRHTCSVTPSKSHPHVSTFPSPCALGWPFSGGLTIIAYHMFIHTLFTCLYFITCLFWKCLERIKYKVNKTKKISGRNRHGVSGVFVMVMTYMTKDMVHIKLNAKEFSVFSCSEDNACIRS